MEYVGKSIIDVLDSATWDLSAILKSHRITPATKERIDSAQDKLLELLVSLKQCNDSIVFQEFAATSDDLAHIEKSIKDAHDIVKDAQKQLRIKVQFHP